MDNQNVRPSSFVKGPVQMGDVNITLLTNFAGAELIQKCDKGFIRGAIINKILYASEIILNQRERMKDQYHRVCRMAVRLQSYSYGEVSS